MQKRDLFSDRYLITILIIAFLFAAYFVYYGYNRYTTYSDWFYDIGEAVLSYNWHIHGNLSAGGVLQYLVFTNHLSPFSILTLPVYAAYQGPIVLFIIQAGALAMAAVAVYFTGRDILDSRKIGFALSIAFLFSPAVGGLIVYDFHFEAFLPLFSILTFYFYMGMRKGYFILSYILFMGVIEEAPFIGATLLLGLLVYELWYRRRPMGMERHEFKRRMSLLLIGFALTAVFLVSYNLIGNYLLASYSSIPYSDLPPIFQYRNFVANNVNSAFANYPGSISLNPDASNYVENAFIAPIVIFLEFGFSSLANPLLNLIMCLPSYVEIYLFHAYRFGFLYTQYYAYALGGSFASAILGLLILSKHGIFGKYKLDLKKNEPFISSFIIIFSITLSGTMFSGLFASAYIMSAPQYANSPYANYSQLNSALATIPRNSTVMTQSFILPHLYYAKAVEIPLSRQLNGTSMQTGTFGGLSENIVLDWFSPQYLVFDSNLRDYESETNSSLFNLNNYTENNYTLYYNKSGIQIYKRN